MPTKHTITELLSTRPYVLAPEIYDCISAKCVEACGFEATVLSSSEFANSYGYPDLGLLTLNDFVDVTRRICRCSSLPMIVDAEEGFGRAIHAYMTAERLAEAGAGGILITDLLDIGIKGMLPVDEAVQRFRAAKAGLKGTDCILVARTEFTPENPQLAYDRCKRYLDAGADMTLIHFGINKAYDTNKTRVCEEIAKNYTIEGDLRRETALNIKRLTEIGCYRGTRHRRGLPVRGQRTKTNARTRKGPKKTIANKKK